jgi:hypothetical protein
MLMRHHEEYLTAVGIDKDAKTHRRRALREVLDVLDAVDGDSWQMRWLASNTDTASAGGPAGHAFPACLPARPTRLRLAAGRQDAGLG